MTDPVCSRRSHPTDALLIIGLVGRAGSGKSTVARLLEARGAHVLDADRLGHEITDTDPEVRAALVSEYGEGVYRGDGHLDRAQVATRVFSDYAALQRLNHLVHPRILSRLHHQLLQLSQRHEPTVVVVDAALLLDWGFDAACDEVLAVTAPEAQQLTRLVSSRGWTPEQAQARLANQQPHAYFERAADEVLVNDGGEAQLREATDAALARMLARRRSPRV
ncbi:MAG: dephospho-CoA kinase [Candidatus Eisenbacteria bacterium]